MESFALGNANALIRRIPRAAARWNKVKVYLEPRRPNSFYFYITNVDDLRTLWYVCRSVTSRHPALKNPGRVLVVGDIGALDDRVRYRRSRYRVST